jgi:putative Mg2+ transporter-C (MgtC) family protein
MSEVHIVVRLLVAAALGLGLGVERRVRGNIAGARTFALLTLGSAGFTVSIADPSARTHVVAGIVTGVGFIGAGTLLRETQNEVLGTATAASVWATAAVGVLCGSGMLLTASVLAAVALLLLELPMLAPIRWAADRLGIAVLDSDPPPTSGKDT